MLWNPLLPKNVNTNNKICLEQEASHPNSSTIVELGEDVENAACQLWDMTAEPDVVSYLLNLNVVDVLQLAKDIIMLSRAPRLTVRNHNWSLKFIAGLDEFWCISEPESAFM